MWRYLFLVIFVIIDVQVANSTLNIGDVGVCLRGRNKKAACCANWKYEKTKGICLPVCSFGCGEGKCISPNTCACEYPLTYKNKKCEQPECNLPHCINPNCTYTNGFKKECQCSEGYEYRGDYNCVPKCTRGCVNGECQAPDQCSCSEGYRNITAWECAPVCDNCENGECIAPNSCSCNDGYTKRDDRCKPICRDCENGECIAPDRCKCNDGYQNNVDGKCEPICNSCTNGQCVLPGECQCNVGYTKINGQCMPQCAQSCANGFCSAPGICTCDRGYQKDVSNESCKPICTKECVNATCVGPDECECLEGYIKSSNFLCKPKCTCENGKCIESNGAPICMCNKGYNMMNGSCKPVCTNRCVNGVCVKEDVCACDDGYFSNTTHPWICTKPCTSCDLGVCNIHGECICPSGYEYINNSCTQLVVDCAECKSFCNETGCWCNDTRPCARPQEAKIDLEPTSTGLAGLQILWLGGAIGAIVLVTTVIFVFRHMWKRQQELRSKEIGADAFPYGSVAYTVPGTLQSTAAAASVPNLYSEENDGEDEEDEQDEAANELLPSNEFENGV